MSAARTTIRRPDSRPSALRLLSGTRLHTIVERIRAVTFLSVPGIAYRGDMTFLQLALGYILARVVVAFVLLPAYFKGEIFTAYQVLERRFGGDTQMAASVLFLITRTLASGLRLFLA